MVRSSPPTPELEMGKILEPAKPAAVTHDMTQAMGGVIVSMIFLIGQEFSYRGCIRYACGTDLLSRMNQSIGMGCTLSNGQ